MPDPGEGRPAFLGGEGITSTCRSVYGAHVERRPMLSNKPENTAQNRARMEVLINSAFKREVIRRVVDVILPLNDIGDGPPFYCIHAVAGVATEFQYLVRMLGPNQKFYAIQVPTAMRNADLARSIEEMSKYYVLESDEFSAAPSRAWLFACSSRRADLG